MTDTNAYGPILDGSVVERAAVATLRAYGSAYLAAMERQTGREPGSLPRVRSFAVGAEFAHDVEDQLPAVTLVAPGLAGEPRRAGDGTYRARWSLGVAVLVSSTTREATTDLARVYVAALRACLVQQADLGGVAEGVEWIDERYDDAPAEAQRTLAAGQAVFVVDVANVLDARRGPKAPPPDPLDPDAPGSPPMPGRGPGPEVTEADVDLGPLP